MSANKMSKSRFCGLRLFKKLTAMILSLLLMLADVPLYAASIQMGRVKTGESVPAVPNFVIPAELGAIDQTYLGESGKTIIYIQDAHASFEAQERIRKIIEHMNREYGAELLLLEGASHPLKPELYEVFDSREDNLKFAEYLLKAGELTVAEVFLFEQTLSKACGKKCPAAVGIESQNIYLENLEAYRAVLKKSDLAEDLVTRLNAAIELQANKDMNLNLKKVFQAHRYYNRDPARIQAYLERVKALSRSELELDLENSKNQFQYPMLLRYYKVRVLEAEIDPEKSEEEKDHLLSWLQGKKVSVELRDSLKNLSVQKGSVRQVLEDLYGEAEAKGFRFENYPEWTKWVAYAGLQEEIDAPVLLREMDTLINKEPL